jgi:hypothetical protein
MAQTFDNNWKRSLSVTPDKPHIELVSLLDLLYYLDGDTWKPRFNDQTTVSSYDCRYYEL